MTDVAALYIDPLGPYPLMDGVDAWDETRNAKLYAGPLPVVAHPPCGPWGNLNHLCRQDPECGPAAVASVRQFGGVLEHPKGSRLWYRCRMPRPGEPADQWGGVTYLARQVEWGHVAQKETCLYVVGGAVPPEPPFPGRKATHWVEGSRRPPGIKACSAQQRRRTPPLFAQMLVDLARKCVKP